MMQIIIFTDLDGTLLHPLTYSFEEARPALERIKAKKIPLIVCSSKTRAEIEVYRKRLGNNDPFVSENGGGVFIPEGYFPFPVDGELRNEYRVITLGRPYSEVRKALREVQERTGITVRGFGDMNAVEVARITGMDLSDAALAKERDFDEPFIFKEACMSYSLNEKNENTLSLRERDRLALSEVEGVRVGFSGEAGKPVERFLSAIEAAGLHWTQGRFYHILGDHDKGRAVGILKGYYERAHGDVKAIGIGDSFNDLPLLQCVDYPVLVRKEDGSYEERIDLPRLIRAEGIGPAGWNEAVMALIQEFQVNPHEPVGSQTKRMKIIPPYTPLEKGGRGDLKGHFQMNREHLTDIFKSAISAADPYHAVMRKLRVSGRKMILQEEDYNLDYFNRIIVVGAGKAAAPMARAVEEIFMDRIDEGVIIVKQGHTQPLRRIRQIEASHPLPDIDGVRGTKDIMDILKRADEKTLVICLLSGGASSLLVSPVGGITLEDKQAVTELLLKAGATIHELNSVRKHLSNVKGGRLAELAHPATLIALILSDVIGDRLDVIASGPTVPDGTTFKDAIGALRKYGLEDKIPVRVAEILKDGLEGRLKETPKGGEAFFKKSRAVVVAGIRESLSAVKEKAELMGYNAEIVTTELQGEAREAAGFLVARAISAQNSMKSGDRPRCLLSGGETTVTVRGGGLGGRNQELALAFAIYIEGKSGITLLSAGTDGTDGPTDAAGAMVDGGTLSLAKRYGLDAASYLDNNDSYHFFKRLDSLSGERHHLMTGPTGTNVMDLQIITVEEAFGF